jgi:hypothetical protein
MIENARKLQALFAFVRLSAVITDMVITERLKGENRCDDHISDDHISDDHISDDHVSDDHVSDAEGREMFVFVRPIDPVAPIETIYSNQLLQ